MDSLTYFVMNATADDWESLEQILPQVEAFHGPADFAEIAGVVKRLIDEGLMEESRRAPIDPVSVLADPIEFWFRMTQRGRIEWDAAGEKFRDESLPASQAPAPNPPKP